MVATPGRATSLQSGCSAVGSGGQQSVHFETAVLTPDLPHPLFSVPTYTYLIVSYTYYLFILSGYYITAVFNCMYCFFVYAIKTRPVSQTEGPTFSREEIG
jgi:hypothetical protein